jgi:linoleate 9S-lipoxygenase
LVFFAGNGARGKLGNPAHLEEMVVTMKSTAAGESVFKVTFDWDASHGIPGAVVVKNTYRSEFLLKTLTLEGVPGKQDGTVVFVANSWIYPGADRVFFANDVSATTATPVLDTTWSTSFRTPARALASTN